MKSDDVGFPTNYLISTVRHFLLHLPAAASYPASPTSKLRVKADTLTARVRRDARAIRTVTLRMRYNDMTECQRSVSLTEPVDMEHEDFCQDALDLRARERRRTCIRPKSYSRFS